MAAQLGLNVLLKVDSDGAGTYQTLGGLQDVTLKFNGEQVDITSQDDTSRYRQELAGAGVKSCAVTGKGVFKNDSAFTTMLTYWKNDTIRTWKLSIPGLYTTITALFKVADFTVGGIHNKEVTFDLTLESAGDITF